MKKDDLNQKKLDCLVNYIRQKSSGDHRWRLIIKMAHADQRIMALLVMATSNLPIGDRETIYKKAKSVPDLRDRVKLKMKKGLM